MFFPFCIPSLKSDKITASASNAGLSHGRKSNSSNCASLYFVSLKYSEFRASLLENLGSSDVLGVALAGEQMRVEALVAQATIEAFDRERHWKCLALNVWRRT